jgi:hypothetical protein
MKAYYSFPCLWVAFTLFAFHSAKTQEAYVTFDTIHLIQTNYYPPEFTLDDTLINRINIQTSAAKQMSNVHLINGGNILRGMITLATGFGLGSTQNVEWYLASSILTNDPKLDWILDVYCPGYVEKQRSRVKNADGSYSLETNYEDTFLWQNGAIGYIIEAGDTIGWHYVYRNPRTDTLMQRWSQLVYRGNPEYSPVNTREFGLLGEFTDKEYAMLYNLNSNRIYIFSGDVLTGIFQCKQEPTQFLIKKKKKRVFSQPYLLINSSLSAWERMDVLRLAMAGLRMKNAVESY